MSSTPTSQNNKQTDDVVSPQHDERKGFRKGAAEPIREAATSRDVLLFLIAFRILNALSIRTFFQPDEYFQSLEPAWEMAFGTDGGAWMTWEWKNHLRSSIHPAIFAGLYWLSSCLSNAWNLSPDSRADLLIAAPKVIQAVFAALGDYYTWRLGEIIYGRESTGAWAALAMTVCSPWQWFCSTRTLSNCLETTLTIAALDLWPWQWSLDTLEVQGGPKDGPRADESLSFAQELVKLRVCLVLAALACVLRPTNILIWICITVFTLFGAAKLSQVRLFQRAEMSPSFLRLLARKEPRVLLREIALCGSFILISSALIDRLYYQQWTFPPLRFLYFNITQSLAVFYGRNDWHYYLSQGYPLLLTTYLPFAIIGLYQSVNRSKISTADPTIPPLASIIKRQLGLTTFLVPLTLSLISHKEVRFIYPLLPPLHILAAPPITKFFLPTHHHFSLDRFDLKRHLLLPLLLLTNIAIALLATRSHQPAPLTTLAYLRTQYTTHHLSQPPPDSLPPAPSIMTVGFLTPCHSTPWRSHLVHAGIKAWALTCDPPLHIPLGPARAAYLDEADRFYANPAQYLANELGPAPRGAKFHFIGRSPPAPPAIPDDGPVPGPWDGKGGRKPWPDYLVFFGQLEPEMRLVLRGSRYGECWRGWNGWGHEDWRRRGGVRVWCVSAQLQQQQQQQQASMRTKGAGRAERGNAAEQGGKWGGWLW